MVEETNKNQEPATANQELVQCLAEVDRLNKELMRAKEQHIYALADLDNARKRYERELSQAIQASQAKVLRDLLAIVDDFDRAFAELKKSGQLDARLSGFEFIYKALHKLLSMYGVEEITQVQEFDPEVHEAITYEPAAGKASGTIIAVLEKGYRFKGLVLRPAKVSVAQ